MDFQDKTYCISLFDIYGKLLTSKQVEYFRLYFIEDFSLFEIAELKKVSRAAAYDAISKIIKNFEDYESKLHLSKKQVMRNKLYCDYDNDLYKNLIIKLKKIDEID